MLAPVLMSGIGMSGSPARATLGFGLPKTLPVFRNHNVLLKPSTNVHANPLVYTQKIVLSGYVSQNNRKLIANSASVVVRPLGSGRVILLAENPVFRAYWYGTNRQLLNGIFLSDLISNSLQ